MLTRGYTLTGLLVSLAIGTALLSAAATFMVTITLHQIHAVQALDVNNHISRLGVLITSQITRAGYDANAMTYFLAGRNRTDSVFYPAYQTGEFPGEPIQSCILFHYDKNHNGLIDTAPVSEQFGFRLHNGAIEARVDGRLCDEPGWQDISEPGYVDITEFRIEPVSVNGAVTLLSVMIEAELAGANQSNAAPASLHWPVTVRNN